MSAVDVQERFSRLNLSDCSLDGIALERDATGTLESLQLDLGLITSVGAHRWISGRLTFFECAGLEIELDLWAKMHTGALISDASCNPDAERVANLSITTARGQAGRDAMDLLVFQINLVPPSGTIRVIAADFRLSSLSDGRQPGLESI